MTAEKKKGQTEETSQDLNPCDEDKSKSQAGFWSKRLLYKKKRWKRKGQIPMRWFGTNKWSYVECSYVSRGRCDLVTFILTCLKISPWWSCLVFLLCVCFELPPFTAREAWWLLPEFRVTWQQKRTAASKQLDQLAPDCCQRDECILFGGLRKW